MPIIIKACIFLLITSFLIIICGYLLRKIPSFSHFKSKPSNDITIESVTSLDVKRKIIKVKHFDKEYILLIGGNNDILIDSLDSKSAIDDIKLSISKEFNLNK